MVRDLQNWDLLSGNYSNVLVWFLFLNPPLKNAGFFPRECEIVIIPQITPENLHSV